MAKVTKKTASKTVSKKTVSKKTVSKKVSTVAKNEKRKIRGTAGNGNHFYNGTPRKLAYEILVKAPKRTLVVKTFLDKIEKLAGVKDRKAARGIVAKILNKPDATGNRNGSIARYVS